LEKNEMNSITIDSGNLAGCRKTDFCLGGGLWINQDFWNFNHSLGDKSLSLLIKLRLGILYDLMRNLIKD
jgi:hypothetical protein